MGGTVVRYLMKLIKPISPTTVVSRELPEVKTERSKGVHVSSVIHEICCHDLNHYEESEMTLESRAFMATGLVFELGMAAVYKINNPGRILHQPGEKCVDGIYLTPDFVDLDIEGIIDTKSTRYSSSVDIDGKKMARLWMQVMSYCWAYRLNVGRLYMLFINGDYNADWSKRKPEYIEYERTFTDVQLITNWSLIVAKAKALNWIPK